MRLGRLADGNTFKENVFSRKRAGLVLVESPPTHDAAVWLITTRWLAVRRL